MHVGYVRSNIGGASHVRGPAERWARLASDTRSANAAMAPRLCTSACVWGAIRTPLVLYRLVQCARTRDVWYGVGESGAACLSAIRPCGVVCVDLTGWGRAIGALLQTSDNC